MDMASFLTLPALIAGAIAASLNIYALSAGADFGGGLWDLLASGPRRDGQRALVADAIGPIWEANHVWLILVIVLLFTAFPPAFALLMTLLHVPMTLMLFGIVLRGSAFTFRSYDSRRDSVQRRWGRIFAVASTGTPVLLGCIVGAIASGAVSAGRLAVNASYAATYVHPWLAPFPIGIGVLSLALFGFLAAVYLTVEAKDDALREDFRNRALLAAVAVAVIASIDLFLARTGAPLLWSALTEGSFAMMLRIAAAASALGAAIIEVSLIIWGWALGQFPLLVPPDVTVDNAAAPAATLRLLAVALLLGLTLLAPSLRYLFKVFKSRSSVEML
jgi:cytochrome d ubiquinol oxidase subunit II